MKLDNVDIEDAIKRQYPDAVFKLSDIDKSPDLNLGREAVPYSVKPLTIDNWSSVLTPVKPSIESIVTAEKLHRKQKKVDLLSKLKLDAGDIESLQFLLADGNAD